MMNKGKKAFIKEWGFHRFVFAYIMLKMKHFLGFRFSIVFGKMINHSGVKKFSESGYSFRPVEKADFENIPDLRVLDLTRSFIEKAKLRKDQCFGAFCQKRLVGYSWSTIKPVEIDDDVYLSFNDSCYYRYKNFVLPEHRGRGLIQKIKEIDISDNSKNLRTKIFSCVESHNFPSLNAEKKEGNLKLGFSLYIDNKVGFYSWSSTKAKQLGLRVYKS